MSSVRESAQLSPGVGTKFIRSNQVCCFLSFFLISWIVATISLLLANKKRDVPVVLLAVTFFATQGVGALCSGVSSDIRGRKATFQSLCLILLCGLIGALISSYPLFEGQEKGNVQTAARLLSKHATVSQSPTSPSCVPTGCAYWILFVSFSIIGIAVGAFYPVTGILLVESVECKTRLLNVALMFSMQGLAHFFVRCGASLIFYCIPNALKLVVLYLLLATALLLSIALTIMAYICVEETSVFLLTYGLSKPPVVEAKDSPLQASLLPRQDIEQFHSLSYQKYIRMVNRYLTPFIWDIVGTALPWLLFDCLFYGDFVFRYLLIQRIKGFDLDSEENRFAIVISFTSLLGYLLGVILLRRISPKLFQILGFTVLAFVFFGLALSLYSISHAVEERHSISEYMGASLMYDCYFRFFNFIPNLTTFLVPLEAFPTKTRGFFVGLAAFGSRVGCVSGILLTWIVMEPHFSRAFMLLFGASVCVVCAAVTRAATPHVLPVGEDLLKLDMIHLTRIHPTSERRCSTERVRFI